MNIQNNTKLFENEDLTNGQKYIEKFQEQLYRLPEPTQELLDSLRTQSKETLIELRDDLQGIVNNKPESDKYSITVSAINTILDA